MTDVIVIDDEEDIRVALKEVLQRAGFEVEVASTGDDGLELLRERGADLIITDVIMPGKNGVETAYDIRMEFPGTKIIVISGGGNVAPMDYEPAAIKTTAYLASASAVGADLTITKPFDREELINAVIDLVGEPS
jgi:DNA-binding response OmpR family regulator